MCDGLVGDGVGAVGGRSRWVRIGGGGGKWGSGGEGGGRGEGDECMVRKECMVRGGVLVVIMPFLWRFPSSSLLFSDLCACMCLRAGLGLHGSTCKAFVSRAGGWGGSEGLEIPDVLGKPLAR